MLTIDSFTSQYRFLSNFYPCQIEFEGKTYPSVEHAFQAAKTFNDDDRDTIRNAQTPGAAKRLGRCVQLRPDWEAVKVDVMRSLLRLKFKAEGLRARLLATGEAHLIEGNTWGDREWGVCRGQGKNLLGQLLMEIRRGL